MEIKRTTNELKKLENRSIKKGYIPDASDYAFRRIVLELLAKISKKKIEEDTYTPQEAGEQRFRCKKCEGDGYIENWDDGTKKDIENKVIKDCDVCKGEGFITINVIDKRRKTKKKDLYYDDEY